MRPACWIPIAILPALLAAAPARPSDWRVDSGNSSVTFAVRHMVVSKVRGAFAEFDGQVTVDDSTRRIRAIRGTIQTASINTNNANRDRHLRSDEFFDVEAHPTIAFEAASIAARGEGFVAKGALTMRGVRKEVEIPFSVTGPIRDRWGSDRMGLSGRLTVRRLDYGIRWNEKLDNGALVVADEVEILLDIEIVRRSD